MSPAIIDADLTDSYVDVDLDGDRIRERVFQVRDCLVVNRRMNDRWEVVALTQRRVDRTIETVRLRPTADRRGVEVVDQRGTSRDVYRYRWTGTELVPLQ